jgi:galactose oxidase
MLVFCSPANIASGEVPSLQPRISLRHKDIMLPLLALFGIALFIPATAQAEVVRTGYTSITAASTAQCLDINGGSAAAGAAAIQWPCNRAVNEQWTVQLYSANAFRIIEQGTGDCLVVSGASLNAGVALVQEPCTGAKSELWSFTPVATTSGTSFQVVNANSGQCMSVSGNSTANADPITQWPCGTAANFLWNFGSGLETSTVPLVAQAAHSGQCMNVNGGSSTAGATIIQWPCAGSTNEQWYLKPTGAYYQIASVRSALCLSNNASTAAAAPFYQETCSATSTANLFTLTPANGSYSLTAVNSGLCVTVPGSTQTTGTGLVQSACAGTLNQLWSLGPATIPSSWTAVTQLPVDPIGVANLPNGNLVMWSANDPYTFEGDIGNSASGQTYTAVFNPTTLASTEVLVTNTGADMFCPGTANLFDGSILVNGGDSSPKTTLYNWQTGLWSSDANMNIPRGYEANTVLANGQVMTLGGSWSGGQGGKSAEVFTQGGAGWTELTNVPETNVVGPDPQGIYRGDNHLWLFTAPNGEVFHAGPSAQMNWITTTGTGTIISAGNRGTDPYAINGNAVLYDVGLIMKTGGAPAYQDANAEANTFLININGGVGNVTVTPAAPMAYPRAFSNGVALPNGQVFIVGGQTYPVPFSDATAILVPEIWDPLNQTFRQLNPMVTPRVYHSTALLLQDGRVYVGGGGQCGSGCSANHFNTEIFTPPYLLNANGTAATRPVISSAPATAALGNNIAVTTSGPVQSFVMMRLSSTTHTVNNDQRRIPLTPVSSSGNTYTLTIPSNSGIALQGYYWIFALNAQGVPSVGSTILIN